MLKNIPRLPFFYGFLFVAMMLALEACSQPESESSGSDSAHISWDSVFTSQGLKNIHEQDSSILVDLRYSTIQNFTGKDIYGSLEKAYLRPEAASMLKRASFLLKQSHPDLRLYIYDAARPRRIQQYLWDVVDLPAGEKSSYVANPQSGSIHNYGFAVDLTLSDTLGRELDMGTGYDNFTEKAHIDKEQNLLEKGLLTRSQLQNRQVLREVMTKAGFSPIRSEWWHFDALPGSEVKTNYSIIE